MNGVHDMGGMHGMGPVVREEHEPTFHHEWERRAFALTLAAGFLGKWNLDQSRYAREIMPPAEYLDATYYERWLWGLEHLLEQHDLVRREEVAARLRGEKRPAAPPPPDAGRVLKAADVGKVLIKGGPARVNEDVQPRFRPGDHVVARNINPAGHTRLPRYARGKRGVIDRDHGVFIFPDAHAAGQGKKPQRLYSVRFEARELWGPEASRRDAIYIDLWDDYLDPT